MATSTTHNNVGTITQVIGAVVDVRFDGADAPPKPELDIDLLAK